jgi:hypothetical protein
VVTDNHYTPAIQIAVPGGELRESVFGVSLIRESPEQRRLALQGLIAIICGVTRE